MSASEVEAFLSNLAVARSVSASTQNQALAALLFLYKEVLRQDLPRIGEVVRAKKPCRSPVVLSIEEVQRILIQMKDESWLISSMLYGTGMRLMEAIRLRVKDVDFARQEILIRDGKGQKDRVTVLPARLIEPLKAQLAKIRHLHQAELAAGRGDVYLPDALERKYPQAPSEWGWQYVFLLLGSRWTPGVILYVAITSMSSACSAHSSVRCTLWASPSSPRRIRCAIAPPRTYWRVAGIFGPYRNCWVTQT